MNYPLHCLVCSRVKPQRHRYKTATCSRSCGKVWRAERWAADRLTKLTRKGLTTMCPIEAYRWGYKAGYQRGWDKRRDRHTRAA